MRRDVQPGKILWSPVSPPPFDTGLCRLLPAHLFDLAVDGETRGEMNARHRTAAAFCAICPVRDACRAYAETVDGADGVWGGAVLRARRHPGIVDVAERAS